MLIRQILITGMLIQAGIMPGTLLAQEPGTIREQALEAAVENSGEDGLDEHHLLLLEQYRRTPLNLNTATEADLQELMLLTPLQIRQLIRYRQWLGPLLSRYELQAVPGWDLALIEQLLPYITVSDVAKFGASVVSRLRGGHHTLLLRASQTFNPGRTTADPVYLGSAQRVLLRYRYQFKNTLQYGVLAEKDAGEEWWGGSQPRGFGFYSAHFFMRHTGTLRVLALGDFTVNMGQGLLIWQSLAFRKGADLLQIRRQSQVLRPYQSSGEYNFHRGIGCTIGSGRWQFTGFASLRYLDGNRLYDSIAGVPYISSLILSGLHRTPGELLDRSTQQQITLGGVAAYQRSGFHLAVNGLHYRFGLPFRRQTVPYNKYALAGSGAAYMSLDFNYTFRNLHLFGELAVTSGHRPAILAGGLISLAHHLDLSWLIRHLPPDHQPLQANAFTENTLPANERGVFTGLSIRPASSWRLDAYADLFRFPWLRYRAPAPGGGMDYMIQLQYRPGKRLESTLRFRAETKDLQWPGTASGPLAASGSTGRKQLRWQLQYQLSAVTQFRCRADLSWFFPGAGDREQGILFYADLRYKPQKASWSLAARLQYFETGGFNSRLYAYEQDVQYSYAIPAFQGRGIRYYLLLKYALKSGLTLWARLAGTRSYPGPAVVPAGHTQEGTFQLQFRF